MKNGLTDLNNYLFEQIEKLNDDELDREQTELAIQKAEAITNIAQTVIKNAELALKTAVVMNKISPSGETTALPKMLMGE